MEQSKQVIRHLNQQAILSSFAATKSQTPELSKGELANLIFQGQTYDCALPKSWIDAMRNRGFDAAPHFVMLYPKNDISYCAPITPQGIRMAAIVASHTA